MNFPARFRPVEAPDELVSMMSELCDQIEDAHEEEQAALLERWHKHAQRRCEAVEFKTYWKSTDKETFVREALLPPPEYAEDVSYEDAALVCDSMLSALGSEHESSYFLDWLDVQFPGANISNLLFWPDAWLEDEAVQEPESETLAEIELTRDQIMACMMAKSGRNLAGSPAGVELPFRLRD